MSSLNIHLLMMRQLDYYFTGRKCEGTQILDKLWVEAVLTVIEKNLQLEDKLQILKNGEKIQKKPKRKKTQNDERA